MIAVGKKRNGRIARAILLLALATPAAAVLAFFCLDWLFPFPQERLRDALATHSMMIFAADGSLISWKVDAEDNWRLPTRLSAVSPWLVKATVAVEDKRFYSHYGVDPMAVVRAVGQNAGSLRTVSGASTITMQTIRLLWPRPRRLLSKATEAFRAVQLERLVGKDAILELYFNLAPYGGNIVGAEAAARRYFGKSASALTMGEAGLLAGIPQSPSRFALGRNAGRAVQRRRQVLHAMADNGMITREEAERAARENVELSPPKVGLEVNHFAEWVRAAMPDRGGMRHTTLNADWQKTVERVVASHEDGAIGKELAGPAVVVLDAADSSVLAYLGHGLNKNAPGWQVDAARSRRQPGSLLKPFIFAGLADRGKISPFSRVNDTPAVWKEYAPKNMDREWAGEMTAAAALRESRNVPAVRQLQELGLDSFAAMLSQLGLDPGDPKKQGLAMALGAGEQRLLTLVNAYAALGRLGTWLPVRIVRDGGNPVEETRVWSEAAAWLTLYALSPAVGEAAPPRVWKTGTSWNRRDAWAVVVAREAVIGVWLGTRTGVGGGQIAGGDDALPLALDIADALGIGRERSWPPPKGIDFVSVCAGSGSRPGWHCTELITAPVIACKFPDCQCARHGGFAFAPEKMSDAPGGATALKRDLKILFPHPDACYIADGAENDGMLYFMADSMPDVERLYWFVDGRMFAVARPGERVGWPMAKGRHAVAVSESGGGNAKVEFSIVGLEHVGYGTAAVGTVMP